VICPLLESRGFVAFKLRANLRGVVEADESVLVGITMQAAIPPVKDLPLSLQVEADRRPYLRTDLLIIDIFTRLVILFPGCT